MQTGTIKGRAIDINRDGKKLSLMLQVEITAPEDIQTVELISQDGEDTNPPDDSKCVIISVGEAYKIAISINDGIEPDASLLPGEKKIYSSDGGVIKAFVTWLKTGAHIISGTIMQYLGSTSIEITTPIVDINGSATIDLDAPEIGITGSASIIMGAPVIEINGSADFAVAFNNLQTAFNTLKTEFDTHVHPHGTPNTGPPTVGLTSDISAAKVTSVKLP